jgi:hypothetical protein
MGISSKERQSAYKTVFPETRDIAGIAIDHSFLRYQKKLTQYGHQVGKFSPKGQTVIFNKID